MTDSCENCRFWKREKRICRRHPPVFGMVPYLQPTSTSMYGGPVTSTMTMLGSSWPLTDATDWCGEHEQEAATPEQIKEVRAVTMEYLKENQHVTKLFRLQEIT